MPLLHTHPEVTTSRTWLRSPSAWGGLLAICGGFLHTATAVSSRQEVWAQIVDEGFLDTVTLDPSADRLAVAEAYWFSLGSFGVPLILLGSLVTWLTRRGVPVPGWLGGGLVLWAFMIGLVGGFDSGTYALLSIGVLLAAGAWTARREPGRRTRSAS